MYGSPLRNEGVKIEGEEKKRIKRTHTPTVSAVVQTRVRRRRVPPAQRSFPLYFIYFYDFFLFLPPLQ